MTTQTHPVTGTTTPAQAQVLLHQQLMARDKVIPCFECGELTRASEMHRWYHADQDDLVCEDCARKLTHTDTAYRGTKVLR